MAESLLCVNCGLAPPAHRRTWDRCTRCAELSLPSTYYCGPACMEAHWPKHKEQHKMEQKLKKELGEGTMHDQERAMAAAEARKAERTGDEFSKRFAAAIALNAAADYHAAAKAWRKLIATRPHMPSLYRNLGLVLHRVGRCADAAPMFLKAMDLYKDGTQGWAISASEAFNVLNYCLCEGDDLPEPQWWNDEGLRALSARAVAVAHNNFSACSFRACVLSGDAFVRAGWHTGPREAADLKEAATLYRRGARLCCTPMDTQSLTMFACSCDELAAPLLAKEKAKAKEAREAAEVRALAAAEELLAEEEKEKPQANTKVSKTKSKGKKGKGKR